MTDHEKRNLRKDALDRALRLNAESIERKADAEQIVKDARFFEAYITEARVSSNGAGDIRG